MLDNSFEQEAERRLGCSPKAAREIRDLLNQHLNPSNSDGITTSSDESLTEKIVSIIKSDNS